MGVDLEVGVDVVAKVHLNGSAEGPQNVLLEAAVDLLVVELHEDGRLHVHHAPEQGHHVAEDGEHVVQLRGLLGMLEDVLEVRRHHHTRPVEEGAVARLVDRPLQVADQVQPPRLVLDLFHLLVVDARQLEEDVHGEAEEEAAVFGGAAIEHLEGEVGGREVVEALSGEVFGGREVLLDGEELALEGELHLLCHERNALAECRTLPVEGVLDRLDHLQALAESADLGRRQWPPQVGEEVDVLLEHVAQLVGHPQARQDQPNAELEDLPRARPVRHVQLHPHRPLAHLHVLLRHSLVEGAVEVGGVLLEVLLDVDLADGLVDHVWHLAGEELGGEPHDVADEVDDGDDPPHLPELAEERLVQRGEELEAERVERAQADEPAPLVNLVQVAALRGHACVHGLDVVVELLLEDGVGLDLPDAGEVELLLNAVPENLSLQQLSLEAEKELLELQHLLVRGAVP
mmetsp:Transcript_18569/g.71666  ORF Transcript_18569/g.71666 Transcript_18569/m.71666 type:complete len:459 (-) Transcript_18569:697-2073(-)